MAFAFRARAVEHHRSIISPSTEAPGRFVRIGLGYKLLLLISFLFLLVAVSIPVPLHEKHPGWMGPGNDPLIKAIMPDSQDTSIYLAFADSGRLDVMSMDRIAVQIRDSSPVSMVLGSCRLALSPVELAPSVRASLVMAQWHGRIVIVEVMPGDVTRPTEGTAADVIIPIGTQTLRETIWLKLRRAS